MVENPKKADHEDLVLKFKRFVKALPTELGIQCFREYYNEIIEEMEKMKDKNTYTKSKMLGERIGLKIIDLVAKISF